MALIQPKRALVRRPHGPFAFPGTKPGFDPSHPASTGLWASAVALGGNFFNPSTGQVGTLTGTPTAKTLVVGNAVSMSGTQRSAFTIPSTTPSVVTLAAIFFWNGTNATSQDICGNDTSTAGVGTDIALTSAGVAQVRYGGATGVSTLPALNANSPYFFAASGNQTSFNVVLCRMDTGQVFSQNVAVSTYTSANGTFTVGNVGDGSRPTNGSVATAMMGTVLLSPQQLSQWAANPWGFWYP